MFYGVMKSLGLCEIIKWLAGDHNKRELTIKLSTKV